MFTPKICCFTLSVDHLLQSWQPNQHPLTWIAKPGQTFLKLYVYLFILVSPSRYNTDSVMCTHKQTEMPYEHRGPVMEICFKIAKVPGETVDQRVNTFIDTYYAWIWETKSSPSKSTPDQQVSGKKKGAKQTKTRKKKGAKKTKTRRKQGAKETKTRKKKRKQAKHSKKQRHEEEYGTDSDEHGADNDAQSEEDEDDEAPNEYDYADPFLEKDVSSQDLSAEYMPSQQQSSERSSEEHDSCDACSDDEHLIQWALGRKRR